MSFGMRYNRTAAINVAARCIWFPMVMIRTAIRFSSPHVRNAAIQIYPNRYLEVARLVVASA